MTVTHVTPEQFERFQSSGWRASRKHGHSVAGKPSPTYVSWKSMRQRCRDPRATSYANYGGAGVQVCDRWFDSFEAFLEDMGERPPNTSLDRFPNNVGNYEPGNCRWATSKQQGENRKSTRIDITGNRYGKLTVLGFSHMHEKHQISMWRVRCDCGTERVVFKTCFKTQVSCGKCR